MTPKIKNLSNHRLDRPDPTAPIHIDGSSHKQLGIPSLLQIVEKNYKLYLFFSVLPQNKLLSLSCKSKILQTITN